MPVMRTTTVSREAIGGQVYVDLATISDRVESYVLLGGRYNGNTHLRALAIIKAIDDLETDKTIDERIAELLALKED